ncbi:hypothetical protein AVEN_154052-1 [Araneus ventricosus]|uniref:Uncharacterized protein n=1 Tax=Araneus ventricosus TaxID=182803 RepID=A0A4Y2BPH5_ARAVE|nr:hypothetical protein AVEN_154052-1 [Araneus ventricosus]
MKNDDGWYVCSTCHEELRYNPNEPPFDPLKVYSLMKRQQSLKSRANSLIKWISQFNLPFEEWLVVDFWSFIHKYEEMFPERKNLISKNYILFHMLRIRDFEVPLKLPKMKQTLAQYEEICRTIFKALNWNF